MVHATIIVTTMTSTLPVMCAKVVRLGWWGPERDYFPCHVLHIWVNKVGWIFQRRAYAYAVMCPTMPWNAMDMSKTENALMKLNFLVMEYKKLELESNFQSRLNARMSK